MKALSIQDLKKTYPNNLEALKGVSFAVEEGDFFALLGPNGAGKSTTIGIITSLVTKTSGKVSVFGHDIDNEFEQAKACIGLVPQEFNFSIFQTVLGVVVNQAGYYGIPRKIATERAEHYLKALHLWSKRHETAGRLSGGLKRRLMIARALVHEPRLLILDEPTAGVDIETRHAMWHLLHELNNKGTTIILTTHYLEEAERLCKNITIINHGQIVENSAMDALLEKLKIETLVLHLANEAPPSLQLANYPMRVLNSKTLEVELLREQTLQGLIEALTQQGISVNRVKNRINRLEELFIDLTTDTKH
ncbi:ABC transporter ATP-binding protein [soil metagenome]